MPDNKPTKTVLMENGQGVIFHVDPVPSNVFNFYLLKKRQFKDGTYTWKVCVELAADTDRYMVLDTVRGTRQDAEDRLDQILAHGA